MTIELTLTNGHIALIDDSDADLVRGCKWYAVRSRGTWYARRSAKKSDPGARVLLHSVITGYALVDHVNGNGLDNRRANLRAATPLQNMQNRRKHTGTSRFKGLIWSPRDDGWRARITVNGRRIHLGYFKDDVEAAHAYDAAARRHFGGFAALNFPQPGEQSALPACDH